jgi:hypothetical protein
MEKKTLYNCLKKQKSNQMLDTYTQTLIESVAETLETMAFIMAMPVEKDLEAPCVTVQVSMSFEGPVNGTIAIMGGNELVELIAANFLGLEPEDKDVHEKKSMRSKNYLIPYVVFCYLGLRLLILMFLILRFLSQSNVMISPTGTTS